MSPDNNDQVSAALEAAHASQAAFNIFTFIDDDVAERSAPGVGPLAGVPIALKDLIDQEGRTTTAGSAFYRKQATTNAACVDSLEAAGAVIIGRTGLHEFAFGFSSENPHWGPVRNPWNPSTSPGGSSGGSAAAVAAGIAPIAIGTDTGGSVRVPAALCGTYGLKVTAGRIPLDGVFPLVPSIDTVGPFANSIGNLERAYRVMSGDDREVGNPPKRIGIPQPWYDHSPTDEDIALEFSKTIETLKDLGYEVYPIEMTDVEPSIQIANAIAEEVIAVHREFMDRGEIYGPGVKERLMTAASVSLEEIAGSRVWQETIRQRFADAFSRVDLLVTPTVPVRAKVIGEEMIGDLHYRTVLSYFSAIVNHALLPAIALPIADSGTPPASLQVIGPLDSEMVLLSFGRSLEEAGVITYKTAPPNSPKPDRG